MEEVYDLHQHTHCVIFHFRKNTVDIAYFPTSTRNAENYKTSAQCEGYITYDKQTSKVLSWGSKSTDENKNAVQIDISRERLYQLYKKNNNDGWDQNDQFLLKAASDFIRLSVEEITKDHEAKIKDSSVLHYVFVTPSEWEEDIRETLIRPMFVQARLVLKDNHQDRLLFCSDVESIYYYLTDPTHRQCVQMAHNAVLGRITTVEENQVLIKLYLIAAGNPLFDFFGSVMFPKILNSTTLSLTSNDIKHAIKEFIKIRFSFDVQEDTIQNIMDKLDYENFSEIEDADEASYIMDPFITDEITSELNEHQQALLQTVRPFDICAEISKKLSNNLKDLLPNDLVKEYSVIKFTDDYTFETELDECLINWSRCLFEYNRISLNSNHVVPKNLLVKCVDSECIISGTARYLFDVTQNSDMHSRPRILPTDSLATFSSIFLNSKPNAIMDIDISIADTVLSFSLLDKNGAVKEIRNHDYFQPNDQLRSLGSFFKFSEVTTLNVDCSFIELIEKYLENGFSFPNGNTNGELDKSIITRIEKILNTESNGKSSLVSTQQRKYIKAFLQIYMTCISEIVTRKISTIVGCNDDIKIGYAITIDNMLLKRLFGTEDDLRDMIYTTRLVKKDESNKKLRITTRGEGLLPVIQQAFKLQFPLKSFFVLAQLYEDYVELTLNQVVTESGLDNKDQEKIIIQEEIIPIRNIYESLCFNMWNNLEENINLIQLCNEHKRCNDNDLLDIFSLKNQAEFTKNLKEYISKNILNKSLDTKTVDVASINISTSCQCKSILTVNNITEVSFVPVLQNIISLVCTSLVNEQLFGNYRNIRYIFHLIRFNYNDQFQPILVKILNDETDQFFYDLRVDVDHYTIPKLSNQLLQPVLHREPYLYKAFQEGVLYHVYDENYGFGFDIYTDDETYHFKNKISDCKSTCINEKIVYPLFKKGSKISQTNRVFYLNSEDSNYLSRLHMQLFKLKNSRLDETTYVEDTLETIEGPDIFEIYFKHGYYVPFIISVNYKGYSSILSFTVKCSGDEMKTENLNAIGEPMTLARF